VVPTLIRFAGGREVGRTYGWDRGEWERLSGIAGLGPDLPQARPGCGGRATPANNGSFDVTGVIMPFGIHQILSPEFMSYAVTPPNCFGLRIDTPPIVEPAERPSKPLPRALPRLLPRKRSSPRLHRQPVANRPLISR